MQGPLPVVFDRQRSGVGDLDGDVGELAGEFWLATRITSKDS